jgi:hypothetical protein
VEDSQCEECCGTGQQPPWGKDVVVEREPGGDEGCDDYEEAEISKASMQSLEVRDLLLAGLLALPVLFGGRKIGRRKIERRHRGIIAYLCAPAVAG